MYRTDTYLQYIHRDMYSLYRNGMPMHGLFSHLFPTETSCKCDQQVNMVQTLNIQASCLPDPFSYYVYTFTIWNSNGISIGNGNSECITVTPQAYSGVRIM